MINVKVIEDSISVSGERLITMQLLYPRVVHAELMTHRVFSRNASSSRAIPVTKMKQMALDNMFTPIRWGLNQPGMQANEQNLEGEKLVRAKQVWRGMAENCADGVAELAEIGLHKQWANRPLEWFGHIAVVVTATEWSNWDALRNHPDAQPEIHYLAEVMLEARNASKPKLLKAGEWHLPYVTEDERNDSFYQRPENKMLLAKISTARCCRVSYLKHDGTTASIEEDIELCDRLAGAEPIHASPFEHQATPMQKCSMADSVNMPTFPGTWEPGVSHMDKKLRLWSGNFRGWIQHRKLVEETFAS